MIDSVDSIIMLYSYSGFPDRSFKLWETVQDDSIKKPLVSDNDDGTYPPSSPSSPTAPSPQISSQQQRRSVEPSKTPSPLASIAELPARPRSESDLPAESASSKAKAAIFDEENATTVDVHVRSVQDEEASRLRRVKLNAMSGLSIVLTLMSILVAFRCVFCVCL